MNERESLIATGLLDRIDTSDPDGCWPWLGTTNSRGRGRIYIKGRGKVYVYRLTYEAAVGPIPDGHGVCHRCDNPICVRPSHLFTGTQRDNAADMVSKGRARGGDKMRGEGHWLARVPDTQVARAKALYAAGVTQTAIARSLGVHQSTVSTWVLGKSREEAT